MVGKATPDRGGPRKSPDGVDPKTSGWASKRTRKTQRDGHNSGVKIWSLCSVSSTLSHANLEQPFRTLAIKWEVNIFLKKSSCVVSSCVLYSCVCRLSCVCYHCVGMYPVYICMQHLWAVRWRSEIDLIATGNRPVDSLERRGTLGKTRWSQRANKPEFITHQLQTETKENTLRIHRKRGRMMNPIGIIVNHPGLKNGSWLTNSQRTSHASVVGNLDPKRERKPIRQKWVVFIRQRFRSSALPTLIRRRKTKVRMRYHSAVDIRAAESKDEKQPVLLRIKFPPASDTEARCMLDNIISKTLHKELRNKDYNPRLNESS